MKSLVAITGFILLLPFTLSAQAATEDVVYLKNGSVLRGEITEMNRDEYLKIEISGRNIFVVMMDEVEEITTEAMPVQKYYKESGYINRSGIDLLRGSGDSSARFYMVNGYQFTPRFSAGIGIGITPYDDPLTLVPFFADFTLRFMEANVSPFLFLKAGYNFSVKPDDDIQIDDYSGGLLFNTGLGVQFNLSSGLGWYINAGYNMDNSYYEFQTWGGQTVENNLSFRRVNFGLGLSF